MVEELKTLSLERSEFEALRAGEAAALLEGWVVYRVTGADALDWFQGQATNDLRSLASGDGLVESCLCSATGQLTALFAIAKSGDQLFLLAPGECEAEILSRIEKMVILEEVELEKLEYVPILAMLNFPVPSEAKWPTPMIAVEGVHLSLVPQSTISDLSLVSQDTSTSLLVLSGTPRFGLDTHAKTLPPELGPDFDARFVHYSKGCYMGQEVLQRIHSRGRTNKTWVQIEVSGVEDPSETDFLTVDLNSLIRIDSQTVYLGTVLRNDSFEYGNTVKVQDSNGKKYAGIVRGMPIYPFA